MSSERSPSAQQRRTRRAIVDAAARLLGEGRTPSVAEIAAEADVSRRTVYLYFSTLEQLLADAALGEAAKSMVDAGLAAVDETQDVEERVDRLVRAVQGNALETEHLGRTIVRLAAAGPASSEAPPRGYRRVTWIEHALEPARAQLPPERFERLVSALTTLIGWEAAIVLRDVRGLDTAASIEVSAWAARALVREALTRRR